MTKTSKIIHDTIIVRDTIYQTITATKIDKAEIYKDILENQTSTNNTIFLVFFGLLTLFVGASFLYNITVAKSQIIKQTNKIFEREKIEIMKNIKADFDIELNSVKGENCRLFAMSNNNNSHRAVMNRFYWWIKCVEHFGLANRERAVRFALGEAISTGNIALQHQATFKQLILQSYPEIETLFNDVIKTVEPVLTDEQRELKEIFRQLMV